MPDERPAVRFTGAETCSKCGGNNLAATYDRERDLVTLTCRGCGAKVDVLPVNENPL